VAVPVVVETSAGPHEVPRAAVEWLWEVLDSHALPQTHAALCAGLNGENVTLPDGERQQFCDAIGGLLTRLQETGSAHAAELADLRAAVCA
jgi:hypothetical protein